MGYTFAQSASLYALLFEVINIYSVYSIYLGVGHFNFIQGYILYKKKFVFGPVRKSKVSPYLKYLLLRDKGWCLQAVRTAGHTLDSTSKPLLVSEVLD